jgi:hypothetical protein
MPKNVVVKAMIYTLTLMGAYQFPKNFHFKGLLFFCGIVVPAHTRTLARMLAVVAYQFFPKYHFPQFSGYMNSVLQNFRFACGNGFSLYILFAKIV